jgi:hypothetical protein
MLPTTDSVGQSPIWANGWQAGCLWVNGRHHERVTESAGAGKPVDADAVVFEPGPIEVLERWRTFGGTWRVVSRAPGWVTLSLFRCDGGEELQRLTSTIPELLEWLGSRTSSEE